MFWKIFFFGFALLLSVFAENSSKEDGQEILNLLGKNAWNRDKMELLSLLISELTNDYNVTLVAYQNIYNDDKTLKEIKTIEFVTPKKKVSSSKPLDLSDEDEDDKANFKEVNIKFDELSNVGLEIQVTQEKYKDDGTLVSELYRDKETTYAYEEKMGYLNRSMIITKEALENYIKKHQGGSLPMAILRYDVDGNFVEKESHLAPSALTSITDMFEADNKIVEAALTGFTLANLKFPNEIPKNLALYMKEKLPNYYWHVTRDTGAFFLKRDVYVTMQKEVVNMLEDYKPYTLFGSKKE